MTTLNWRGRVYAVELVDGIIRVSKGNRMEAVADAEEAVRWLSCNSLRKGKARKLVADELNANFQGNSGELSQLKGN